SSNTVTAGACTGLGVAPRHIGEVFGIFKAYSTRVGSGPFPTELLDEQGDLMRKQGNEFGSTTGRPRRCGWIDLPSLKYSIMINGVTQLLMMKADVLSVFPRVKVCTGYKLRDGRETDILPYEFVNEKITPIYEELEGWLGEEIKGEPLPGGLQNYIEFLERELAVPITLISTGPDRSQTIYRQQLLVCKIFRGRSCIMPRLPIHLHSHFGRGVPMRGHLWCCGKRSAHWAGCWPNAFFEWMLIDSGLRRDHGLSVVLISERKNP